MGDVQVTPGSHMPGEDCLDIKRITLWLFHYCSIKFSQCVNQQGTDGIIFVVSWSCAFYCSCRRVIGRSDTDFYDNYANAHNKKLNILLKRRDIMAVHSSSHWSFDRERLVSPQLELQLVIVRGAALYLTGSAGNNANSGEVSLKYNLWPVCQRESFYCHWFVHLQYHNEDIVMHKAVTVRAHGTVGVKRCSMWTNEDAFCFLSTSAEVHKS